MNRPMTGLLGKNAHMAERGEHAIEVQSAFRPLPGQRPGLAQRCMRKMPAPDRVFITIAAFFTGKDCIGLAPDAFIKRALPKGLGLRTLNDIGARNVSSLRPSPLSSRA